MDAHSEEPRTYCLHVCRDDIADAGLARLPTSIVHDILLVSKQSVIQ